MSTSRKGKRVAVVTVVVGVLVLGVAGYALRDRIRAEWLIYQLPRVGVEEQWEIASFLEGAGSHGRVVAEDFYIAKLSEKPGVTKDKAAERLGEVQSVRSVPHLLRLVLAENEEQCSVQGRPRRGVAVREQHLQMGDLKPWESIPSDTVVDFHFTPILHAIHCVGPESAVEVRAALRAIDAKVSWAIGHRGGKRCLEHLLWAWSLRDCVVHRMIRTERLFIFGNQPSF